MKRITEEIEIVTIAGLCTVIESELEDHANTDLKKRALISCSVIKQCCVDATKEDSDWAVFAQLANDIEDLLHGDPLLSAIKLANIHYWNCASAYRKGMKVHMKNILAVKGLKLKSARTTNQYKQLLGLVETINPVYEK